MQFIIKGEIMMNNKIIVLLLLIAIVLSFASVVITFNFDSEEEVSNYKGNSASVGLVVEKNLINTNQGGSGE